MLLGVKTMVRKLRYLVTLVLVLGVAGCSTRIPRSVTNPDSIRIESPSPHERIRSPFTVKGSARGPWYFEGDFAARLLTSDGHSLGTVILTAQSNWMTSDFVEFQGRLTFENPDNVKRGRLVFESANPSGRPDRRKTAIVPVKFSE